MHRLTSGHTRPTTNVLTGFKSMFGQILSTPAECFTKFNKTV